MRRATQRAIRFPKALAGRFAVSAAIIAILLAYLDLETVADRFASIDLAVFFAVSLLLCAQALVAALRWHVILKGLGAPLSMRQSTDNFVAGGLGNIVFLTSVGGMSVRGFLLARRGLKLELIAAGLLAERIAVAIGLALVFLPAALVAGETRVPVMALASGNNLLIAVLGVAVLALAALLLWLFLAKAETGWLRRLGMHLVETLRHPVCAGVIFALSCAIHLSGFAAIAILAAGLGVQVPLVPMLAVLPLVAVLSSIPVSLGGWGVREGSMVLGFALLGIGGEEALTVSVLYGLSGILAALALAAVFLIPRRRLQPEGG